MSAIYEIAISPDSFEDWPIPLNQMVSWAFEPADEETLRFYIAKGRADAKVRHHQRQETLLTCFKGCDSRTEHHESTHLQPEDLCLHCVDHCRLERLVNALLMYG